MARRLLRSVHKSLMLREFENFFGPLFGHTPSVLELQTSPGLIRQTTVLNDGSFDGGDGCWYLRLTSIILM